MSRKRPQPMVQKPSATPRVVPWRHTLFTAAAALLVAFLLYSPAIHAPFFFDDDALNIRLGERDEPIRSALLGHRPVLSTSYWIDYQFTGDDPSGYRYVNLVIHAANVALVFLVLYRLLEFAGWDEVKRRIAALLGAAVFLVHPLQTESVAYIAGRSESFCALFMLLAWAVFLYRQEGAISWGRAAAVLTLSGLAVAAKENGVAIGGVLLLTDLFWSRQAGLKAVRANWRLYLPAAILGLVAVAGVARILAQAETAGSATGITGYQYALTQSRAILTYLRLALLPYGQSVDHDFPISHTLFEHAAIACIITLAALAALAWIGRRRFPLAAFGLFLILILLAPTSSLIPIADPLVERRMYLPLLGLILAACDLAGRWRVTQAAVAGLAVILFVLAILTYQRNTLWSNPEQMWSAAAALSTHKSRPYLHVAELMISQNRCPEALSYMERAERLMPEDGMVQVGIARSLECLGRRDEALARLQRAAAEKPGTGVYQWLGLLEGAMGRSAEAGAALKKAVELGPANSSAHSALGLWYESVGDRTAAIAEYQRTIELNYYSAEARTGLQRLTGKSR